MKTHGHYWVDWSGAFPYASIDTIRCTHCAFVVDRRDVQRGWGRATGLITYARMRGKMITHLHQIHRDQLQKEAKKNASPRRHVSPDRRPDLARRKRD